MWLLLLIPMLGMTSVLFARTEEAVNPDDNLRFSSSDTEMSFRLPQPVGSIMVPPPQTISVIGDDEVISDDANNGNVMRIRQRNIMMIQINKLDQIHVKNGLVNRIVTIDELKDLAKQFIQNPDHNEKLPVYEEFDLGPEYGVVMTTFKHVFSFQYDRSSSSGVCNDVRYELSKAYEELRDELCQQRFGKDYDECSESQQQFARAMYAMKISEAEPLSYDAQGNLITKEIRSAAANPELAKTNSVNKDLRIRVSGHPAWLYASTVLFENENGQDRLKSETEPEKLSVEELNDFIDKAISDGMRIRKVRIAAKSDVPQGIISDVKQTIRNRMLLNIVYESYKD